MGCRWSHEVILVAQGSQVSWGRQTSMRAICEAGVLDPAAHLNPWGALWETAVLGSNPSSVSQEENLGISILKAPDVQPGESRCSGQFTATGAGHLLLRH